MADTPVKDLLGHLRPGQLYAAISACVGVIATVATIAFGVGRWVESRESPPSRAPDFYIAPPTDRDNVTAPRDGRAVSSASSAIVVDFNKAGTSPRLPSVGAGDFLAQYRITIGGVSPAGTALVIKNGVDEYGGAAVGAQANFLTQAVTDDSIARPKLAEGPAWFELLFPQPMYRVVIERIELIAGHEHGTTHPAWQVTAFDDTGAVVASHFETLLAYKPVNGSDVRVPRQAYPLLAVGPKGIQKLRITSDYRLPDAEPFAGSIGAYIGRLELIPCDTRCR